MSSESIIFKAFSAVKFKAYFSERHQNWANGTTSRNSQNPTSDSTDTHVSGSSAPATPTGTGAGTPTFSASDVSTF